MKQERDAGNRGRSKRILSSAATGAGPNLKKFLKLSEEHQATLKWSKSQQEAASETSTAGGSVEVDLNRSVVQSRVKPDEVGAARAGLSAEGTTGNSIFLQNGRLSNDDPDNMLAQEPLLEERQVAPANNVQMTPGSSSREASFSHGGPGDLPASTDGQVRLEEMDGIDESPSDVLAAIQLLHSQFPKVRKKVDIPPIILKSQVYSIVKNRTDVDRELEVLKHRHKIRVFKLVTVGEEYALTLSEDYAAQIRLAQGQAVSKGSPAEHVLVFDWFLESVVPGHVDAGITDAHLRRLLSGPGRPPLRECHVSLLIQSGLLVRQLADTTAFWFAIPNVGLVIKSLVQGRKELVGFLSRRKYQEILQSELSRRNLRYSILGMRFHLRDLLGSGRATVLSTTVGPLIRLSRA